jgi:hypothetical protein
MLSSSFSLSGSLIRISMQGMQADDVVAATGDDALERIITFEEELLLVIIAPGMAPGEERGGGTGETAFEPGSVGVWGWLWMAIPGISSCWCCFVGSLL